MRHRILGRAIVLLMASNLGYASLLHAQRRDSASKYIDPWFANIANQKAVTIRPTSISSGKYCGFVLRSLQIGAYRMSLTITGDSVAGSYKLGFSADPPDSVFGSTTDTLTILYFRTITSVNRVYWDTAILRFELRSSATKQWLLGYGSVLYHPFLSAPPPSDMILLREDRP